MKKKVARKQIPFPAEIFVRWEDDGDGGAFLAADESAEAHANIGEDVPVAVYTKTRTTKVRTKVLSD